MHGETVKFTTILS